MKPLSPFLLCSKKGFFCPRGWGKVPDTHPCHVSDIMFGSIIAVLFLSSYTVLRTCPCHASDIFFARITHGPGTLPERHAEACQSVIQQICYPTPPLLSPTPAIALTQHPHDTLTDRDMTTEQDHARTPARLHMCSHLHDTTHSHASMHDVNFLRLMLMLVCMLMLILLILCISCGNKTPFKATPQQSKTHMASAAFQQSLP